MREIGKNLEPGKVQRQEVKFGNVDKEEEAQIEASNEKEIKDFSNPTEMLGRSQVNQVDNLQTDVSFGLAHPNAITSADKFFEMTYNQLLEENNPEAYEVACSRAKTYVDEFHS